MGLAFIMIQYKEWIIFGLLHLWDFGPAAVFQPSMTHIFLRMAGVTMI